MKNTDNLCYAKEAITDWPPNASTQAQLNGQLETVEIEETENGKL